MNKILMISVIILLFVIIGEIYYLFIYKKAEPEAKTVPTQMQKVIISPTGIPTKDEKINNEIVDFIAINTYFKDQGVLLSSKSEYIYEYRLEDIQFLNTNDKSDLAEAAIISFKTADGKLHTVKLNNYDLKKTRVLDKKNSTESIIGFTELKKGDKIRYFIAVNQFAEIGLGAEQIVITRLQ